MADTSEARAATPEAEVPARVAKALEQIEAAQNLLYAAAANLSPLVGAIPLWERTVKLGAQVKTHWYRLDAAQRARARKWTLDGVNMSRFEAAAPPSEAEAT